MTCSAEKSLSPICDFLKEYAASGKARLHMPGHKGRAPEGYPDFLRQSMPFDLTEVQGADALYEAEGIIGRSEELTAELYGAGCTCYSAGGSTLSILAMVSAAVRQFGKKILAVRNAHLAFVNACVLTGADPVWVFPAYDRETGLCLPVTPEEAGAAMDCCPDAKIFYLTSPDYYGVLADVAGIAREVHRRDGILLCDSAHGSHLPFSPGAAHPMALGTDLCCDSPHKTLPVLTGGGLLHGGSLFSKEELKTAMSLFGSTSPSYLIMASLDACQCWLRREGKAAFTALDARVRQTEEQLRRQGITLLERKSDCTKITLDCQRMGYTHGEIAALLRQAGLELEFCGGGKIVLMVSPQTPEEDFVRLEQALRLPLRPAIPYPEAALQSRRVLTVREAALAPSEEVPVDEAVGRIAAVSRISCPPGIPVVCAGEEIGEEEKILLKNSGIFSIFVIK